MVIEISDVYRLVLPRELVALIDSAAERDERSRSGMARVLFLEALAARGLIRPADPIWLRMPKGKRPQRKGGG